VDQEGKAVVPEIEDIPSRCLAVSFAGLEETGKVTVKYVGEDGGPKEIRMTYNQFLALMRRRLGED